MHTKQTGWKRYGPGEAINRKISASTFDPPSDTRRLDY